MVAEDLDWRPGDAAGPTAGYMAYRLRRDYLELLSLAVAPEYRRLGFGKALVDKLKAKLSCGRRTRLTLTARESNLAALKFFRSQRFLAVAPVRGFYEDSSGEDGILMEYVLPEIAYQEATP